MPQLAFANSFWESYDVLDKTVKAGVRKAMTKFQRLTIAELHADKGLHLETVRQAKDPRMRTIRIDDSWRGVVLAPDDGSGTFLLLTVVSHAKAYGWAAKRLYTVNAATRGLEVRDAVAIEQLTPTLERVAAQAPSLLFAAHSDPALRSLGIDDQVLRAVRTIMDRAQLAAFGSLLPEDQFEVLEYLAEGFSPEEVYRDVVAERRPAGTSGAASGSETLEQAIVNTASRMTLVRGVDDLAEVLAKPFAAWRVFLHPSQRRVAYRPSYPGSAQVTGGPGTGKTVAALHRVKHLVTRSPGCRVLFTTYTTALAGTLREQLSQLLADERLASRVRVTTVDAFAHQTVRAIAGRVPTPISGPDELQVWRRIHRRLGLAWSERFLAQEYHHVILAQNITDRGSYLVANRRGRGTRIGARQRERIWEAVELFISELASAGQATYQQICQRAADLLGQADLGTHGFDHIVVDEAQDLHPAQWRVLRAAVAPGPDDLFVTGDPHQRIYDNRVTLGSLGIDVVGRTSRLRINYRSTEEILDWAVGLMASATVGDLAGDGSDNLVGYRSPLRGRRPILVGHPTERDEAAGVAAQVGEWIDQGVRSSEIAVCARFNLLLNQIAEALAEAGVVSVRLRDHPGAGTEGVRLGTMHAMKGLEYRCVAVAGATATTIPFVKEITPERVDRVQHDNDLLRERCVLFVACTRAREALRVSWSGEPSPFLAPTR